MVTLQAGQFRHSPKVIVHREFACHYSPVLKAAFDSDFKEGQTQIYNLIDASDQSVTLLGQWLYTQRLDVHISEIGHFEKARILCELWILADKLRIPRLQNTILHQLEAHCEFANVVPTSSIRYIWDNTSPGAGLRRWLLYQIAHHLKTSAIINHPERFPPDILLELAVYTIDQYSEGSRLGGIAAFNIVDLELKVDD